ncbi:MAG: glycosyltransferase family 4 protein [Geminicoccaceae bacterium]|nr:glycosyltransferase family 4 protein [Geminicoccaceae bacterium]
MIYIFYNNDPLAQDQGGGAEHFRGLYRAMLKSSLDFRLVGARLQHERVAPNVAYISESSNFLRFYMALWGWFWRNRKRFKDTDVFHFHRNYAAWPKLVLAPGRGRVLISYHNVTGRVLDGWLGRLARPLRALMLMGERRVAKLADAIVCVSGRDRKELRRIVVHEPFERALVIPAAFDGALFNKEAARPPGAALARRILAVGRISHQKNMPLAIAVLEVLTALGHDFELTIAGDGEDSRTLVRRIAESPARERVKWVGRVPHDRMPGTLAEHGILLLTSRYEASPTVVKEALKAMRPVVSTDVGDVPDWLDEGVNGFVRGQDAASLAEGIIEARRLVEAGAYRPASRMDLLNEDAIMNRVVGLYRRLQAG